MNLLLILLFMVIGGMVGAIIGQARNSVGLGFILGFVLGPIGWLIVCFNDAREQCPECKGRVPDGASKCMHCGGNIVRKVGVRCPACNNLGVVRSDILAGKVECPACKYEFPGQPNVVRIR